MPGRPLILDLTQRSLAPPPLPSLSAVSLFLDLDGTLLDLVDEPDHVFADDLLKALLTRLAGKLDGRLAIVSGRSIAQIDAILGPLGSDLVVSGSHGTEHRWQDLSAHPIRPRELDEALDQSRRFADPRPGIIVEDKSFGVALHYRMAPERVADVEAFAAELAARLGLQLQAGKMMAELRLPGGDKGKAITTFMSRAPMLGSTPWFIGDDETDEPGFVAAQALGGDGILVGKRRPTAARHWLADPAAVRQWLERLAG